MSSTSIPQKMRAAVCHSPGKPLKIEEVDVPQPQQGQVLIKVEFCGVCHTDLHACKADWPVKPSFPLIPGHEIIGRVVKLGDGVQEVKEGDRVGLPWLFTACTNCEYCTTSRETLCDKQKNTGYNVPGGYAEYVVGDSKFVVRISDKLNGLNCAPILCAGLTTYKGLLQTNTKAGDWVVIFGIGGLGHLAVEYAIAMARRVIAVDIRKEALELAERCGARITINAQEEDPTKKIMEKIGGAHAALVTAVSNKPFQQAVQCLRKGGTVSLVGLPPGDFPAPIFPIVFNEQRIQGSIVGTRQDLREALEFYAEGKICPNTKAAKLDDINDIFEKMENGKITGRMILDFTKGEAQ